MLLGIGMCTASLVVPILTAEQRAELELLHVQGCLCAGCHICLSTLRVCTQRRGAWSFSSCASLVNQRLAAAAMTAPLHCLSPKALQCCLCAAHI